MSKKLETKQVILDKGLMMARSIGYESISIGELAKEVGMSKSGVFAHFKSKETLQVKILEYTAKEFTNKVILPALTEKRGLKRLKRIISNWESWSIDSDMGSCPLIAAAIEFDTRPGVVKDTVIKNIKDLHETLARSFKICVEEGELSKNTDINQVAQELFAFFMAYHIYSKTLADPNSKSNFNHSVDSLISRNLP